MAQQLFVMYKSLYLFLELVLLRQLCSLEIIFRKYVAFS